MSGIAGIIHFDGKPIEPGLIEKMTSAMAHRGPDGINHWVNGSVALGQCMLRTTPESLEEHQPLANEDESLVLVMDGRVDNWEDLRRELLGQGAMLRDRSDAELVLRSYDLWGNDCLQHIDGDFALVIWDESRQQAFCARDRMGCKPFNYHWIGKTLVFASELHAILLLPWVEQKINEGILAEYLADNWFSRNETLWCEIMRLVAAQRMLVDSDGLRLDLYWLPDLEAILKYRSDEEYVEHYWELLKTNVKRMSRSHRMVACEVSGGLDSSAIFCVAEHLHRSNRLFSPGIEGYTLAFTDDKEANELKYVHAVNEFLGIKIKEIPASIMPLSWYAERAVSFLTFPGFPNGIMHLELIHNAAKVGSRVLLNGNGGDEWLGGSRFYYSEELAMGQWVNLYENFKTDADAFGVKKALEWFLKYGCFPLLPAECQRTLRRIIKRKHSDEAKEPFWLSPHLQKISSSRKKSLQPHTLPDGVRSSQILLLGYLNDAFSALAVEETERLCAGAGVETRSPLNSPSLVQFAFSTPERIRLHGARTKYVHSQAIKGIVPRAIIERTSKAAFPMVFCTYLDHMREIFTEKIPRERSEWVTSDGMIQLYNNYHSDPLVGSPPWSLWAIYVCDKVFK